MKVKTSPSNVADRLGKPEEMLAYLEACIEKAEGEVALIANALGDIVRARCTSKSAKP